MRNFLHVSGAVAIGVIGALALIAPWLAFFGIIGYFYIAEHLEDTSKK